MRRLVAHGRPALRAAAAGPLPRRRTSARCSTRTARRSARTARQARDRRPARGARRAPLRTSSSPRPIRSAGASSRAEFGALLEAAPAAPRPAGDPRLDPRHSQPARQAAARPPRREDVLGRYYDGVLVHGDEAVAPLVGLLAGHAGARRGTSSIPAMSSTQRAGRGAMRAAVRERRDPRLGRRQRRQPAALSRSPRSGRARQSRAAAGASWSVMASAEADFEALAGHGGPGPQRRRRARPAGFPGAPAGRSGRLGQPGRLQHRDRPRRRRNACRARALRAGQGGRAAPARRAHWPSAASRDVVGEAELDGPDARRGGRTRLAPAPLDAGPPSVSTALPATGRAIEAARGANAARAALGAARRGSRRSPPRPDASFACGGATTTRARPRPALDRLLALARRHRRARRARGRSRPVEPSSGERIAGEPLATCSCTATPTPITLPPAASKRELGDRPADIACGELAAALRQYARPLRLALSCRCWCRPGTGSTGARLPPGADRLSRPVRRRQRALRPTCEGLVMANTHWDPIDWRGSRSLADEAGLDRTRDGLRRGCGRTSRSAS